MLWDRGARWHATSRPVPAVRRCRLPSEPCRRGGNDWRRSCGACPPGVARPMPRPDAPANPRRHSRWRAAAIRSGPCGHAPQQRSPGHDRARNGDRMCRCVIERPRCHAAHPSRSSRGTAHAPIRYRIHLALSCRRFEAEAIAADASAIAAQSRKHGSRGHGGSSALPPARNTSSAVKVAAGMNGGHAVR